MRYAKRELIEIEQTVVAMKLNFDPKRKLLFVAAISLISAAAFSPGCTGPAWDDPSAYNSDHFDLRDWKITLPVADEDGEAKEVKKLKGYESQYFYDAKDGAMVFWAPVEGSTTKNSNYPRSELRERIDGKDAAWKLSQGGTMTATLQIEEAPKDKRGKPGKIVIGQIHGEDDELVRLYWDREKVYFKNDRSKEDNKEHRFRLRDKNGRSPKVSLGEIFSYKIDARGDRLEVMVHADGQEYGSVTKINPVWQSDTLYFKAGAYLGVNASQKATGAAKVLFYGLDAGHAPGEGIKGLNNPAKRFDAR